MLRHYQNEDLPHNQCPGTISMRTSLTIRRTTPALKHRSSSGAPLRRSNIGVLQAHHSGAQTSEVIRRSGAHLLLRRSSNALALFKHPCAPALPTLRNLMQAREFQWGPRATFQWVAPGVPATLDAHRNIRAVVLSSAATCSLRSPLPRDSIDSDETLDWLCLGRLRVPIMFRLSI